MEIILTAGRKNKKDPDSNVIYKADIWFLIICAILTGDIKVNRKINLKLFVDGKEIPKPAEIKNDN